EPGVRLLMTGGFPRDAIGKAGNPARVLRGPATRESSHSQVEAAPEEMNRARLALEASPQSFAYSQYSRQAVPQPLGRCSFVGSQGIVLGKRDGVGDFVW